MFSLVLEHVPTIDIHLLCAKLSYQDIKFYMFQLLQALDYAHSMGIMHRDVKPHNVTIDHSRRQLRLIDWGLAEFYHPGAEYSINVGTKQFKAPELLLEFPHYDYSLDLWSFGCMFAGLITRKLYLFQGDDNVKQLGQISRVLGTDSLYAYVRKYSITLSEELENLKARPPVDWGVVASQRSAKFATPLALDLISRLLLYDHQARATALEAMHHPYFDELKKQ